MDLTAPFSEIYYHPSPGRGSPLPFYCRSVSHRLMTSGEASRFVAKPYYHLSWCVAGEGEMLLETSTKSIRAGDVVILAPGTRRQFRCYHHGWHSWGLSVQGDGFGALLASMMIDPPLLRPVGPCPETEFMLLKEQVHDMSLNGIRNACLTVFNILTLSVTGPTKRDTGALLLSQTVRLIEENIGNPELNVDWLAETLQQHRSSLSRQFKALYGLSPSSYILQKRLQRAMNLIKNTSEPINDIAQQCGFTNPDYFSRFFRQRTGYRPGQFRRDD